MDIILALGRGHIHHAAIGDTQVGRVSMDQVTKNGQGHLCRELAVLQDDTPGSGLGCSLDSVGDTGQDLVRIGLGQMPTGIRAFTNVGDYHRLRGNGGGKRRSDHWIVNRVGIPGMDILRIVRNKIGHGKIINRKIGGWGGWLQSAHLVVSKKGVTS